jgi:hypothetical protein
MGLFQPHGRPHRDDEILIVGFACGKEIRRKSFKKSK